MVAVGYELVHNLTEASDVGMCCAWSHYGTLLAAAHQDGTAAVWEHRSGRLVAKYRCAGAARNVKFAVGPVDLLAISEHEAVVHLLDARRWDAVERVQATPPRPPHMSPGEAYDISGIAFTPKVRPRARGEGKAAGGEVTCCPVIGLFSSARRRFLLTLDEFEMAWQNS